MVEMVGVFLDYAGVCCLAFHFKLLSNFAFNTFAHLTGFTHYVRFTLPQIRRTHKSVFSATRIIPKKRAEQSTLFFGGDGGSRTHVQNGSIRTSTSVGVFISINQGKHPKPKTNQSSFK